MMIELINENRLNHIHYCRVHKENQRLSGSFWVPSKSKSKNKKMFSIELNDSDFLVCDPEHIFKQKISVNKPSECILNLMNILILSSQTHHMTAVLRLSTVMNSSHFQPALNTLRMADLSWLREG